MKSKQEFPAMQWYPDAWLSGRATRLMTPEQRGMYIDLLAHAWLGKPPCSLPDDDAELATLAGTTLARWRSVGSRVRAQFEPIPDAPGLIRNDKQYEVYTKQQELRDKRGSSGQKGGTSKAERHKNNGEGVAKSKQNGSNTKAKSYPLVLGLGLGLVLVLEKHLIPTSSGAYAAADDERNAAFTAIAAAVPPKLSQVTPEQTAEWFQIAEGDLWWLAAAVHERSLDLEQKGTPDYITGMLRGMRDDGWCCGIDPREYVEFRLRAMTRTAAH